VYLVDEDHDETFDEALQAYLKDLVSSESVGEAI
jgi:hypothetical protein